MWRGLDPAPGEPFDGAVHPDQLDRPLYGASFGDALRRFFRGYVRFEGRASRSEFWWAQLFMAFVYVIPSTLLMVGYVGIFAEAIAQAPEPPFGLFALLIIGGGLTFVISLALMLPSLALYWRRLHDANYPGPMYFLAFIPYVGSIIVLVFACLPSTPLGRRFDRPIGY